MKKLLLSLAAALLIGGVSAQQDYQMTNFMFDRLSFNPAYAGANGTICVTPMVRNQWSGFAGSPTTFLLNAHSDLSDFNPKIPLGVGLTFVNEEIGPFNNTKVNLSIAYKLHKKIFPERFGELSAGLSYGIFNTSINNVWIYPDGSAGAMDASIPQGNFSAMSPAELSFGVYYKYKQQIWGGISMNHLAGNTMQFTQGVEFQNARHFYLMGGYNFGITNFSAPETDEHVIRASVMSKTDFKKWSMDINVNYLWKQMLWFGVSYRTEDAISPMLGWQTDFSEFGAGTFKIGNKDVTHRLRVGYSYDVTLSKIRKASSGSHELFVNYCITIPYRKPITVVNSTRHIRRRDR